MAWTMQATVLCLLLKLNLAQADFTDAVEYIYDNAQAIRLLFLDKQPLYVVGGTFAEDPLLRKNSGIPFKCGIVQMGKLSEKKFSLQRRIYTARLPGKWLITTYDMKPNQSEGYRVPNCMDAYRHQGNTQIYSGRMYLLLSDRSSCALFYHKQSGDCELWESKRPKKNELPSSFCSKYLGACNNKHFIWYYKFSECFN
ncbi:uncharacterized protein LOC120843236 [Ixodes scapularis]|uniref:uncharacterized protein LOC120843236 n=1 Tax=Ixodes scapularis TaxID=6945 RepID=UPI001A9D7BEA|nr:uncharacterized protein LOC120843236 [Ixodes scapularis]